MNSKDLDKYFSPLSIIKILCKYRIKCATKARKKQLLSELSSVETIKKALEYKDDFYNEIKKLLPPRSSWLRPKDFDRKGKDSVEIAIESIRRRIVVTHYEVTTKSMSAPLWYANLQNFISQIQLQIQNIDSLKFTPPKIIPEIKDKIIDVKTGAIRETICRPISVFSLQDRIIIGLSSRYLLTIFEEIFLPYSYAFKPIKYTGTDRDIIKHHHAIKDILRYRIKQHPKKLWVSECDINKFFDTVNHNVTYSLFLKGLDEINMLGRRYDQRIVKIFREYLNCYSFKSNIIPLNANAAYFSKYRIEKGKFEFPFSRLQKKYYYRHKSLHSTIGIPQGGAISCFIANLLLHEADKSINNLKSSSLFYCRYCDDMMLMHPNPKICALALHLYKVSLRKLKLLIHTPKKVVEYKTKRENSKSAKDFWKVKSKEPYLWDANEEPKTTFPWIGFVGYQIRYDGNIRVRKKSLEKELGKQKEVITQTLKSISYKRGIDLNTTCEKTKNELLTSVNGRLNAMSIGKCELYNSFDKNAQKYCWLNGFSEITKHKSTICQLKRLDRSKNRHLNKLKKKLNSLTKTRPKEPNDKERWKEYRFYGLPFSYSKAVK